MMDSHAYFILHLRDSWLAEMRTELEMAENSVAESQSPEREGES